MAAPFLRDPSLVGSKGNQKESSHFLAGVPDAPKHGISHKVKGNVWQMGRDGSLIFFQETSGNSRASWPKLLGMCLECPAAGVL